MVGAGEKRDLEVEKREVAKVADTVTEGASCKGRA
jgi:hypothetical protein